MNMLERVRAGESGTLVAGVHAGIIQSILDFDFLSGKQEPSVVGIVTANRKALKLFFGPNEILLPCFKDMRSVPGAQASRVRFLLNLQSGRRTLESTLAFFDAFPESLGAHVFAENTPESHALELARRFGAEKLIAGPSGVGLFVSGHLKLGAIGGVDASQIEKARLPDEGSVAVVSTSGGMTNELIRAVVGAGRRVSFALCIGGDRFPGTSVSQVFRMAEEDPRTTSVVYFGELGGADEYEIVRLIERKEFTKPLVAYVAGVIDEAFDEHVQFGHAKALVRTEDESARAKRAALSGAGAGAPDTFSAFLGALNALPEERVQGRVLSIDACMNRTPSILSTREIVNLEEVSSFVKDGKLVARGENTFASAVLSALLGRAVSPETAALAENIFELLLDHGGEVSGAVNTMITARAGKDLVSSLASGLLTVGPRFGGAVNAAAEQWLSGVSGKTEARAFVEERTRGGNLLSGIGHRKYRVGLADPRVAALSEFASLLEKHPHYDFARAVEDVTTKKSGNLILNVDGVMAALFLDMLAEKDGFSQEELRELVNTEFFNALFVIPRSVGFIAHFMEQKKNDEGLFRLPEELLFVKKKK